MPFDGNGNFQLLHDFQADRDAGFPTNRILAEAMMDMFQDVAGGLETSASESAARLAGTSTTSTAIGTGSKVFTTQAGKAFTVGRWLLIASNASGANYMHGRVTAYSGTSLTVLVTNIGGSGTLTDWTITIAGTQGAKGDQGDPGAQGDPGPPGAGDVSSSRQVASGGGLTGGGDLSADRTLAVGAGTGIAVNADDVALDTSHVRNVDHSAVQIASGAGLTGGGTIEATRTLAVGAGTGIVANADDVAVDKASDANVRAAASNKVVTSDLIESAATFVALSDAASVAVDWDSGINFSVTITASRAIANPTNGQPGTWRSILVTGNDATDRTITFGNQFLGELPTITDCDSGRSYILLIQCITSTWFHVSAKRAS